MNSLKHHFGALDFYRFLAAFGVAALHFSQFAKYDPSSDIGHLVGNFALFVDFFFILSGFVIALTYSDSVRSTPQIFDYLRRRIARIYPIYFLTLMVFLAPALIGASRNPGKWTTGSILSDIFLVKTWPLHAQLPFNYPAWSINVEWAMYLAFPLIMLLYRRLGIPLLICLILAGFGGIEYLMVNGGIEPPLWFANISPARALPTFAIGILIAETFRSIKIPYALPFGVAAFCCAVAATILYLNVYLILILFSASIFLTANGSAGERTIFDTKLFSVLGNASYSLYMLHAIALTALVDIAWPKLSGSQPPLWYGAVVLLATTLAAIASFHLIENPTRDLLSGKRHASKRLATSAGLR